MKRIKLHFRISCSSGPPGLPGVERRLADGSVLEFAVAFSIQGFA